MKTQELNLVSSPTVARLEKLETSGFLTPAFKVMTRLSRDCGGQSTPVADEVTRLIFSLCASPHSIALMRNHHASAQSPPSWTAVVLYRFPIWCHPLTLPKAHPQPPFLLCVFAPLREAFLSPLQWSFGFGPWSFLSPQRQVVASTAGCTSKNIFSLNQQTTTLYTR
jgi:hypothetical protein